MSRVIRGCCIPRVFTIAPMKLEVKESTCEAPYPFILGESVVFGLSKLVTESLPYSDNVVFGATMVQSEDLQDNLSESVTITNP